MKINRFLRFVLALVTLVGGNVLAAVTYYHNDLLGSAIAATDESRAIVWKESYRPYGERIVNDPASTSNSIYFTGRRQDPGSGLVYMGARYYEPALGRFLSPDLAGFEDANIHSFSRYAYANNSPFKFRDPDGRNGVLAVTEGVLLIGAVVFVSQPRPTQEKHLRTLLRGIQSVLTLSESNDTSQENKGDASNEREPPVPGATPGRETKGRTTQWVKGGGEDQANRDFDEKKPKDVTPIPEGGRRGTLPDGRQINVRPDSTDGRPTLEIQSGKSKDKVRYNE